MQRLLSALCDGDLSTEQHARLEELLSQDEAHRELYLEYLDLHARLAVHPAIPENGAAPLDETLLPVPRFEAPAKPRVPQALRYVVVAAATLAASLLLQVVWWHPEAPVQQAAAQPAKVERPLARYVATLTDAAECVWENPQDAGRVGSRLLPVELRLRQGIARIHFDGGADLMLEGPAALRLDSGSGATLVRGKVVFRADETAALFDLHTPSSTLLDLGTEYAVSVGPEGEEVHVFEGEVQRRARTASEDAPPETLAAGEARRYGRSPDDPGKPTALDPERFTRRLADANRHAADPAAGLLAYEGFDYPDPWHLRLSLANGGAGWVGPWRSGFARPTRPGDQSLLALNVNESLVRPRAAQPARGGCIDYTGFAKYWRRLATPVRLDTDGVYYLSYLFRRSGPPADEVNAVAVLLRTADDLPLKKEDSHLRLNIGVGGPNQLFTHLQRVGSRTSLPLSYDRTYLLVAKIVASGSNPDQVFMRVYDADEPVEREESGSWTVVGPPFQSDLVFEWLEVHVNSMTRQMLDEIRLGTTWSSVTAAWRQ
jgi:ferric-dicitrate binding protein FerR (iron transport regulator)